MKTALAMKNQELHTENYTSSDPVEGIAAAKVLIKKER